MNTPDTDVKDFEEEGLIQTNPITPDTEWESVELMATNLWAIIYEGLIKDGVKFPNNFDGIGAAYGGYARIIEALEKERTSRDTYWKERVEEARKEAYAHAEIVRQRTLNDIREAVEADVPYGGAKDCVYVILDNLK